MPLTVTCLEERKIVQIWLTQAEKKDPELQARLKPLYQKNKAQGYMTVVYKSGDQELKEGIRDLLLYNKRKLAELEVQQEKQSAVSGCE